MTLHATYAVWQVHAKPVNQPPSRYTPRSVCAGAPLPGIKFHPPGYDVFEGVTLADAYTWKGCPDDVPDGPVALLGTPQVLPSSCAVAACASSASAKPTAFQWSLPEEACIDIYGGFSQVFPGM